MSHKFLLGLIFMLYIWTSCCVQPLEVQANVSDCMFVEVAFSLSVYFNQDYIWEISFFLNQVKVNSYKINLVKINLVKGYINQILN